MALLITSIVVALLSVAVTTFVTRYVPPVSLLGGFLRLSVSENPGIAFSIRMPPLVQTVLIVAALIVVIIIALRSERDRIGPVSFGLVIGGAVANIDDRWSDGLVTDYVGIGTFPVFNAADACISIGVGLLLLDAWMKRKRKD